MLDVKVLNRKYKKGRTTQDTAGARAPVANEKLIDGAAPAITPFLPFRSSGGGQKVSRVRVNRRRWMVRAFEAGPQ